MSRTRYANRQFHCRECDHDFRLIVEISPAEAKSDCPKCGNDAECYHPKETTVRTPGIRIVDPIMNAEDNARMCGVDV